MTSRAPFIDALRRRWQIERTLLCVGLDPDPARLPEAYRKRERARGDGLFAYCCDIVDATAEFVCGFKPQFACFAALGREQDLANLITYVHERHPGVPVILDAKRGDIGATARFYAREAFERYDADAVTVNPYLGPESVAPFLAHEDRGVIVLCRTSNPDSGWLQDFPAHEPAYLRVARAAVGWNAAGNVMLVAGATYADELRRIRAEVDGMPLLVPGIGTQGGDIREVVHAGAAPHGDGLVINASRAILFADPIAPLEGARRQAQALRDEIRDAQATLTARPVPV